MYNWKGLDHCNKFSHVPGKDGLFLICLGVNVYWLII